MATTFISSTLLLRAIEGIFIASKYDYLRRFGHPSSGKTIELMLTMP
jgi:hypothetical protein